MHLDAGVSDVAVVVSIFLPEVDSRARLEKEPSLGDSAKKAWRV
jgi:hypothetical protein